MSRITPVQEGNASPEAQEQFDKITKNGARIINLYRTLAHNPRVMRDFIKLGNTLLSRTELPPKLRELAVLRLARLTGSQYEWTQHYPVALQAGLTAAQADALTDWARSGLFNNEQKAVLKFVDEMVSGKPVSDAVFQAVRAFLSEKQAMELAAAVGYWEMVGRFLAALQVDIDRQTVGSAAELFGWKK